MLRIPSRRRALLAVLLCTVLGVLGFQAAGAPAVAAPVPLTVTMLDFKFKLSRQKVPVGKVRFTVVNRGAQVHDFLIGAARTRRLKPGEKQTLTVTFRHAGRLTYRCSIPGHVALGMKGVLQVGAPPAEKTVTVTLTTTVTAPASTSTTVLPPLELTEIGKFERPVLVTSPPGDARRVYVVTQTGVVHEIVDGVLQPQPLLDIRDRVRAENETGLLGLAFAPDYAQTGRFYVNYNQRKGNGDLTLVEYVDKGARPVDPDSGRTVYEIVKPWENHNGGMLEFGPDGSLYISVGNGDSGVLNKPGAFSQTLDDLLGDILRIDPRSTATAPYTVPAGNPFAGREGAKPEIWAYGLRNPWRFDIDPGSGDMLIGDVGEGAMEELDLVPAGSGGGQNFGFPCFEGTLPLDRDAVCTTALPPAAEWPHSDSVCSITAGVYVHDPRLPALDDQFLVADYCGGDVLVGKRSPSMQFAPLGLHVAQPTSFGKDGVGRVYVCSLLGNVYRIDPL